MQTYVTYKALKNINEEKIPFVLSRSTWPGSGKYGSTWTGDNAATWEFLRYSISGIFNFNVIFHFANSI